MFEAVRFPLRPVALMLTSRTMRTAGQGFLIGTLALVLLLLGFGSTEPRPLRELWFVPFGVAVAGAVLGGFWPRGESPRLRRRAWLLAGLAAVPTFVAAMGVLGKAPLKWDLLGIGMMALLALLFAWAYSAGDEAARRAHPIPLFMEPPWDRIRQALPPGFEPPAETVNVLIDLELDVEGFVARATAAQGPSSRTTIRVTADRTGRRVVEPNLPAAPDLVATAVASGFVGLRFEFENPDDAAELGRFRMGIGVRPEDLRPLPA